MKANALMKHNIDAILKARGQTRKDLAAWCRRGESWISKIMKEDQREFPMKYFDRIADFCGISAYQLLQPGISHLTERRSGRDRRMLHDRRIAAPVIRQEEGVVDPLDAALIRRLNSMTYEKRRRVERWIDVTLLQEQRPKGSDRVDPQETVGTRHAPTRRTRGKP